jgi:hypothetical protein
MNDHKELPSYLFDMNEDAGCFQMFNAKGEHVGDIFNIDALKELQAALAASQPTVQGGASVDTDSNFVRLLNEYRFASTVKVTNESYDALIAHIDAHVAAQVSMWRATVGVQKDTIASLERQLERATQAEKARGVPEGMVIAPHYRGYANLGTGQYVLNHSKAGEPMEFVISVATEAEKAGRVVGDERDNAPDELLQPEAMAVRIAFSSLAGLEALENQIRKMKTEHGVAQNFLTDEQINAVMDQFTRHNLDYPSRTIWQDFARTVERFVIAAAPQAPHVEPMSEEQCRLRLCCRDDAHAKDCTTYDPNRYPENQAPAVAEGDVRDAENAAYFRGRVDGHNEAMKIKIRALRIDPAKPSVDLVEAIKGLEPDFPKPKDGHDYCREEWFGKGIDAAAALVAAHLKGTP